MTWASAILIGAAGLLIAHHPTLLSGFGRVQGELGDTRFVNWLLEHNWRWLIRDPAHLRYFDPPMFHPAPNTLAYSESLLGSAPAYLLWRALGFEPDTSFQLWHLTVSALNFASAMLFLRRGLRLGPWSSAAGAALFAFAGTRIAQIGHAQLLPHFPLPLLALALLRFADPAEERRAGWWVALGSFALVDQIYAGFYLGWFQGFGLLLVVAWALALRRTRAPFLQLLRKSSTPLIAGAAVAALALAPLGYHYALASREVGSRPWWEVSRYLPRPASWLGTSWQSWLYGWSRPIADRFIPAGYGPEHMLGYGALATVLGVLGLVKRRRETAFCLLGAGALSLFLLTLVPAPRVTLWRVVFVLVPGGRAVRVVARVGLVVLFPICAGVAATLDRLERRRRFALLLPCIAALLVEQGLTDLSFDKQANRADLQWVARRIPEGCSSFLFTPVDGTNPWYKYEIDAIWAGTMRQVPTLNGYSGNSPPKYLPFGENVIQGDADRRRVAGFLSRWTAESRLAFDPGCWIAAVPRDSPAGGKGP